MRGALLLAIAMAFTGCTIVPVGTANQACQLLNTASAEADLAPAWHEQAGEILAACGQPDAKKDADDRTCAAEKRNGYACKDTTNTTTQAKGED